MAKKIKKLQGWTRTDLRNSQILKNTKICLVGKVILQDKYTYHLQTLHKFSHQITGFHVLGERLSLKTRYWGT